MGCSFSSTPLKQKIENPKKRHYPDNKSKVSPLASKDHKKPISIKKRKSKKRPKFKNQLETRRDQEPEIILSNLPGIEMYDNSREKNKKVKKQNKKNSCGSKNQQIKPLRWNSTKFSNNKISQKVIDRLIPQQKTLPSEFSLSDLSIMSKSLFSKMDGESVYQISPLLEMRGNPNRGINFQFNKYVQ